MKAILWDMDGTILDSEPAHEAAFSDAIAELGLNLPPNFHESLFGASSDQVHAALIATLGIRLSSSDWVETKWRHYKRHARGIKRREPSAKVLLDLASRGVPMGLVSNSTAQEVDHNLHVTGLRNAFDVTISRNDVPNGKPEPDGYLLAARRLGFSPEQCLVIEDSPTGARAGISAGMDVLFHPQKADLQKPRGTISIPADGSPSDQINLFLEQSEPLKGKAGTELPLDL